MCSASHINAFTFSTCRPTCRCTTILAQAAARFLRPFRVLWSMLIHRPVPGYAYPEDIPGSRCSPDDGPWPRPYKILQEDDLWREFASLAKPQSTTFDSGHPYWRADSVNFQPSHQTRTQDRYVVTQLNIHGRMWTFTGVFDGAITKSRRVTADPTYCRSFGRRYRGTCCISSPDHRARLYEGGFAR